ncbi:MAG: hypothetical protein V3U63_02085, partial [Gemmatimonadota bacterium]
MHDWAEVWGEGLQARLLISRASLWIESRPATRPRLLPDIPVAALPEGVPGEVPPTEDPAPADAAPADTLVQDQNQLLPDAFSQYADLGIIIQGRVELGGGWTRSRPCNVSIQLSCEPRLIPDLNPDIQFGARVGGTVSERIHVSVDYDNRREFDAANNINLFYQGLEDEIIQRIEVGDVTFPLPQNRFLNEGIPAGNFGFRATGQMGPIDFQGV